MTREQRYRAKVQGVKYARRHVEELTELDAALRRGELWARYYNLRAASPFPWHNLRPVARRARRNARREGKRRRYWSTRYAPRKNREIRRFGEDTLWSTWKFSHTVYLPATFFPAIT